MRPEGPKPASVPVLTKPKTMNDNDKFFAILCLKIKAIGQLPQDKKQRAKIEQIKKLNRLYSSVLIDVNEFRKALDLVFVQ